MQSRVHARAASVLRSDGTLVRKQAEAVAPAAKRVTAPCTDLQGLMEAGGNAFKASMGGHTHKYRKSGARKAIAQSYFAPGARCFRFDKVVQARCSFVDH